MSQLRCLALLGCLIVSPALAAEETCGKSEPIFSTRAIGEALLACWLRPHGADDMGVTLRFALRRDGTVIASPRVTYRTPGGDRVVKEAFVSSAMETVNKAVPLAISPELGEIIAGKPLTVIFSDGVDVRISSGY
ncbi:hypothetical protein [Phyllobacterium endophyticum]|uniref:TonB C-terminal domain-containing protein n=1 Tax=Phyllobacterium endophyticum TaxID=1149773 RepID=A0A2P7AVV9_9HYPH|nr:hypothetical protein [Phyllobacterium endophyticum]MBB3234904.1 hypothetical protein [Phyllobacterium endophyticum]PSH58323.1 hypothetical protein CU100_11970 [Phyllobacterium endophyticum]TYR39006.1 hypothetical protein FY050_23895 [Phyllobacterium endophyticum]